MGLDYTAYTVFLYGWLDNIDAEWHTVTQQLSIELCHHTGWLVQLGSGTQGGCSLSLSLQACVQLGNQK